MHGTARVASHVAALVSIQWLAPRAGGISPNWLLYGIPLSVGVVQWAFLSKSLPKALRGSEVMTRAIAIGGLPRFGGRHRFSLGWQHER